MNDLSASGPRPEVDRSGNSSIDRDIETGARIQRALLTGRREHGPEGIDSYAEAIPSSRIDGDFFDFLSVSPGSLDFMIGDVMGKGIPAALTAAAAKTAVYRSLIRQLVDQSPLPNLVGIMTRVDRDISENLATVGTFLTLDYCRIEIARRTFRFVDAGHTGFCFFDASDGSCWLVKGSNMPLGFKIGQAWRRYVLPVGTGDLFFFYSDGISEAEDVEGTRFGEERIRQLVKAHADLSAEDLVKKTLNIMFFYATNGFRDDVTALAVRVTSTACAQPPDRFFGASIVRDDANCVFDLRVRFSEFLSSEFADAETERLIALELGFVEAISNVVEHSRGDARVRWSAFGGILSVEVDFNADVYECHSFAPPDIAAYPEGGFGNFIINESFDSLVLLRGRHDERRIVMVGILAENRRS